MLFGPLDLPRGSIPSSGVVKYKTQSVAQSAPHLGYAVADLDSSRAANALHRPLSDGNDGKRSLGERQHPGGRLPARALFDQNQLTALKIDSRPVEQQDGLERKMDFSIQILMQAIVITRPVAQ